MQIFNKFHNDMNIKLIFLILSSLIFGILLYLKTSTFALEGDVGCFSAIGQDLLHGKILYKEVFDNKAPGIFFIHAFFQWITFKSIHYQAIMHCSILSVACFLFLFWISRDLTLITSFWISNLFFSLVYYISLQWVFFQYGGFTEEIGMCFLISSLSLLFLSFDSSKKSSYILALIGGVLLAVTMLIKEPFVLSYLVFLMLFIQYRINRKCKKNITFFHLGLVGILLIFLFYLLWNNAISDYINYLSFATNYAIKKQKSPVLIDEIKNLYFSIYGQLKLLFWVFLIYGTFLFKQIIKQLNLNVTLFLSLMIISSIFFIKMGQVTYLHYYIPFILSCLIFFIYIFSIFVNVGFAFLGNKFKMIILSGLFIYAMNQFYLKCNKKIKIEGTTIESELDVICVKKLKHSNCYIDEQGSGRFYYYLNCYSGLKYPCPYYVYYLENNDSTADNSQVNRIQKEFHDDFNLHPPKYMITQKELSPAFYYGALNEKVGLHYRTIDSFTVNEIKFYIRQRRKSDI